MARPQKLDDAAIADFVSNHAGWERKGDALEKTFRFPDFSAALGFVVRVGLAAERHDHHPDVELGWGRAKIVWSTHDAKGITALDIELATKTDALVA